MSRVIKFRAYAKPYNRYCDVVMLDEQGWWTGAFEDGGGIGMTTDIILEQDTGVLDIRGRRIYENDLLKIGLYTYEVKRAEDDSEWLCYRNGGTIYTPLTRLMGEIVGNIHDRNI